jgi:signal transduction histidine kinase
MHVQAMRVYEMIADMMLFARPPQPRPATCDVTELIGSVADDFAQRAAERDMSLTWTAAKRPLLAEVDAEQLTIALRALVDNAIAVGHQGGHIRMEAGYRAPAANDRTEIEIVVRDDGPGISAEVRRHLFDPYFSGRGAGRGLGLGLSKCWRIVMGHGGSIDVASVPGQGAAFTIRIPGGQTSV